MSVDFTPPVDPSVAGIPLETQARTYDVKLGDGYSQRARQGLNHLQRTVTLNWDTLSPADADTLEAFFEERGGDLHFRYLIPFTTRVRKWVAQTWSRNRVTALTDRFSAELVEVYDL